MKVAGRAIAVAGLAAGILASVSSSANAAEPASSMSEHRGYVYGAPVFFAAPLGDDDVKDLVSFSYQWGLGVGGFWALGPKHNVGIAAGFAFEHSPATLDDDLGDACDFADAKCQIHVFRLMPEVRVGGVLNRLYAYGVLAPGLGLVYAKYEGIFADDEDTDAGFNLGLGGGVQYMVWRQLFVGGELGFDLGFYTNDEVDVGDDTYAAYTLDLKGVVGWYF
jgi:hypothetical protein